MHRALEAQVMKLTPYQRSKFRELLSPDNRSLDAVSLARSAGLNPLECFARGEWDGVDFGANDLSGLNFRGADLRGADLSKVVGLQAAIFDADSRLPSYLNVSDAKTLVHAKRWFVGGERDEILRDLVAAERAFTVARSIFHYHGEASGEARSSTRIARILCETDVRSHEEEDWWALANRIFQQAEMYDRAKEAGEALALSAMINGDYEAADELLENAFARYSASQDSSGQAACLHGLACVALARGDFKSSRDQFELAKRAHLRNGNDIGQANAIEGMADVALARADYAEAELHLFEVLNIYRLVRDRWAEATIVSRLGGTHIARNNFVAALEMFSEGLERFEDDLEVKAMMCAGLGAVAFYRGDGDLAKRWFEEALTADQEIENELGVRRSRRILESIPQLRTSAD